MRYQNIIWDWNGTLLDDVDLAISVINEILLENELEELTVERYKSIFDFPVQTYYERAGMNFTHTPFETVSARFCETFESNLHTAGLFQDVSHSLKQLKLFGIRHYLLSATEHQALLRMTATFDIGPSFDDIAGMPDGLARNKTDIGHRLVRENNITASHTLMVGDTKHDWEVANALGVDCVLVSTGHHSHERLSAIGCPVFESVSALIDHLKQTDTSDQPYK